ncbi:3-deoxy-D-manno-octulosonic acid transferase [Candidatus Pelagibacter communis]|uniref:3-deoxy-D-manno-octulosonic acid transferase n=1 Tax=Pelagibacter ubique TaxID=198252 RepID=UPI00094C9A6C|nr:glycosyltransferase N-terminal domain-containing protein [Candidatus Pelagibacter ubique]
MKLLYGTTAFIIYPLLVILVFLRKIFNKEDRNRYKEKIFPSSFNVKRTNNSKLIMFHAASIGELKSILPIIKELEKKYDNLEILVTTLTISSANLAKTELKKFKNATHRFLPLDVNFLMRKFLTNWKPDFIFLVDSEIWPNLIFLAKKRKIPLGIINARITKKTYKRWILFPKLARSIFGLFDLCIVSNQETKKFLENLNAKNIFYFGNLKFCENIESTQLFNNNNEFLKSNKFWLAASTHEGEDEFCLNTHIELQKKIKNVKTIIVPRHISRVDKIKKIGESLNLTCQILNPEDKILNDKEIIIINSIGKLQSFYKYSKSVFIGKSTIKKFEEVGGQNPIEAAKLGCKIYHGPFIYNFKDIYLLLAQQNVSKQVNNCRELVDNLILDLNSSKENNVDFISLINHLEQKILNDSMKQIKLFINENK